jgi:spore coat polysaccharide biosynthesis predicted glycosyltransferase SpsG/CMP-N-acetylneuraminic acid synthetase
MIPARGGSRGLPRKNVRLLAGLPLIVHVIRAALEVCDPRRVVVITDDDEIDAVATAEGVTVTREPTTTGNATLDDVARKVAQVIEDMGARDDDIFLTVQPTCPFLRGQRILDAVTAFEAGAASVISVVDDRHLGWRVSDGGTPRPDYQARVNRQKLPPQFRETGAVIGCRLGDLKKHGTRIIQPIHLIEVDKKEALDIDDFSDWAVAQYRVSRRSILIRADANEKLGMGHVFRALAVAQELAHHDLTIACDAAGPLAASMLSNYPFDVVEVSGDAGFVALVQARRPDLVVLDQLDTERAYVQSIKAAAGKVVTFEDQGEGAQEADLLISDLYGNLNVPDARQLSGIANAILAPNFETSIRPVDFREKVENILLLFGGTDPSGLTEKTLSALAKARYDGECSVVIGPGFKRPLKLEDYNLRGTLHSNVKFMPGVMRSADMAISSAGRTITELTSLGIPVLCLCQNAKELTHTHAAARFGVIGLGMGSLVDEETIAAHIDLMVESQELRAVLRNRALHETGGRRNSKIMERILGRIGWH